MSVLEAMSVARPVIAANVGGVSEVVLDGETGWLIGPGCVTDLAERLVFLARNRWRAAQLGKAGRDRQRRFFSAEATATEYARLLTEVGRQLPNRPRLTAAWLGDA
jgi:glycosyltransferase involved in cell wall biosynthesis